MIYDIHTHLFGGRWEQDKITLLKAAEHYQMDKLFVSGLNETGNPNAEMVDLMNGRVHDFRQEHPDLIEGYVYLSPELPEWKNQFRRAVEDWGFVGVKLWMSTFCDDPRVFPVMEQAIEYDMPVLIHSFYKAVGQLPLETTGEHVARLAKRYPESRILMAHLGGNEYHSIPPIRDCENVWVDISGSIFRNNSIGYTVDLLGEDRVLYGTDLPGSCVDCIGQVMELEDAKLRDKIFYRNAQKLFEGVLK